MYSLFFIIIGLVYFEGSNSFVPIEDWKKDDSQSGIESVDPEISSEKIHRKSRSKKDGDVPDHWKKNSLENIVLAIDTGVKKIMAGKTRPDIVDTIAKFVVDFTKNNADPKFRTKGHEYNIKPEVVHFRSDKPSVMLELNSQSILNGIRDLLRSRTVRKYMDTFSKEAALIYRTIKTELDKAEKARNASIQAQAEQDTQE